MYIPFSNLPYAVFVYFRYAEQKSEKVYMKEGKSYYITIYQKAEKLGDCASVAMEMPSGHFEGPIKQKHLSWKLLGKYGNIS